MNKNTLWFGYALGIFFIMGRTSHTTRQNSDNGFADKTRIEKTQNELKYSFTPQSPKKVLSLFEASEFVCKLSILNKFCEQYADNTEVAEVLGYLAKVQEAWTSVKYSVGQPDTLQSSDGKKKTEGEENIILSEEQFVKLKEVIEEIRAKIVV